MRGVIGILLFTVLLEGASTKTAEELSRQATEVYRQARYAEAEALYRQALDAWKLSGPEAAFAVASDKQHLGNVLRAMGNYREAERLLLESCDEFEALGVSESAANSMFILAALYRAQGDLENAEKFALRSIESLGSTTDARVRQSAKLILGSVYLEERRFGEAEKALNDVLECTDGALATAAYSNLASVAIARGEYEKAVDFANRALHLAQLVLPAKHQATAAAWNNLAQANRLLGRYLEAEVGYRNALAIWEDTLGPWHPDLAKGLMNLGAFYHERGRESGAEDLYSRAAAIFERAFGNNDLRTLLARNELADVLRAERRFAEADKLGRATLTSLERQLAPDDARLAHARQNRDRLMVERSIAAKR